MINLPDGTKFEMQWKQVAYIRGNDYAIFEIIPMLDEKDIIIVPDSARWSDGQDVFSNDDRMEMIFLLERIAWKRDVKVVEMDISPHVNEKLEITSGMFEATEGYKKLAENNLFDPDSMLNKTQVKEIYCKLEKRFAEAIQGTVKIPKELLIKGSVMNEVSLPAIEGNKNAQIVMI